jgi:CRP/FNR family transcriptional regulator
MMAAVASDVRLARFLLWMSARMEEAGQSPRRLLLRMCRRDIASLLGVAHETVSRSFTTLADAGLLTVQNREVDILDLPALRGVARSTRGGAEDCSRRRAPLARVHPSDLSRTWFPQEAMLAAAA